MRRLERELVRNDAAEDLSELSEGETKENKGEGNNQSESFKPNKIFRINSDLQIWSDDNKSKRLYIILIR